jgi:predicted RNase H-like nuclease (RuvC/YqgF family)
MSAEHDKNVFLHEIALSGENDLNRLKEGDSGKANRKIWALEQQIEELKLDSEVQKLRYKEEMEKEVGVSNGLRDRIGTLDEKRRKVMVKLEEAEGRESGLKGELEALRASTRIDIERLGTEVKEAREALASAVEKDKHAGSQSRVQMVLADQQSTMTR